MNFFKLYVVAVISGAVLVTAVPALARPLATEAAHRDQAIHQCNSDVASLREYTWGGEQSAGYRACMARHGEQE